MLETWKRLDCCIIPVEVSTLGRIRNPKHGRILTQHIGNHGYWCVKIRRKEKLVRYSVHRLVALAHIPGDPSLTVNHKDGDKLNNALDNLEWISHSANVRHEWSTGLVDVRGMKNGVAKLTDDDVREIRQSHDSYPTMATRFGVTTQTIYRVRKRTRWAHLT